MRQLTEIQSLFFSQWKELFDEQGFDSYQVRFSTPLSVLDELEKAIHVASSDSGSHHNIDDLAREAQIIYPGDPIISKHFPFALSLIKRLVSEKCSPDKPQTYSRTLEVVRLIQKQLHQYPDILGAELKTLFSDEAEPDKPLIL